MAVPFAVLVFVVVRRLSANPVWAALIAAVVTMIAFVSAVNAAIFIDGQADGAAKMMRNILAGLAGGFIGAGVMALGIALLPAGPRDAVAWLRMLLTGTLAGALLALDNALDLDLTSVLYPVWQAAVAVGWRWRCGGRSLPNADTFSEPAMREHGPDRRGPVACASASRALRHLIEKAGDAPDPSVLQHGEIRALDRAVDAVGAEPPGEADMIAKAVGLADQLEFEIRKSLLHAGDQRVDAVMAVARHQRVDISGVAGPVRRQHLAAAARRALVPQIDIADGNGLWSVMLLSFDGAGWIG